MICNNLWLGVLVGNHEIQTKKAGLWWMVCFQRCKWKLKLREVRRIQIWDKFKYFLHFADITCEDWIRLDPTWIISRFLPLNWETIGFLTSQPYSVDQAGEMVKPKRRWANDLPSTVTMPCRAPPWITGNIRTDLWWSRWSPRRWSANVLNFTSDPEHSWAPQPNLSWAPTSAVPTARSLPWLFVGKYICHGQIVYMYDIVWEWVMVCYGHHPYVYIYIYVYILLNFIWLAG